MVTERRINRSPPSIKTNRTSGAGRRRGRNHRGDSVHSAWRLGTPPYLNTEPRRADGLARPHSHRAHARAAPGPRRAAVSSLDFRGPMPISSSSRHRPTVVNPNVRHWHTARLARVVCDAAWRLTRSRLSEVKAHGCGTAGRPDPDPRSGHRAYRAAVVARTGRLRVWPLASSSPPMGAYVVPATPPVLVGLCTGQGAQYGRMATAWLASGGVVAETLREADAPVKDLRGTSLLEVMARTMMPCGVPNGPSPRWWPLRWRSDAGGQPWGGARAPCGPSIGEIAAAIWRVHSRSRTPCD